MLRAPLTSVRLQRRHGDRFRVGCAEVNGWRPSMEDTHVVVEAEAAGLFAICDGHAGADCAEFLRQALPLRMADMMTLEGARSAFKAIDEDFRARRNPMSISGSTCVLVAVPAGGDAEQPPAVVAHVGDSRAALVDLRDGALVRGAPLTADHSPGRPDEAARIEASGSAVHWVQGIARVDGGLAVSRAFGDFDYKTHGAVTADPEVQQVELWPMHTALLLYCDGAIEGSLSDAGLAAVVTAEMRNSGDAALAARAVCLEAIRTGSRDNVSCMVVLQAPLGTQGAEEELEEQHLPQLADPPLRAAHETFCSRSPPSCVRFSAPVPQRVGGIIYPMGSPYPASAAPGECLARSVRPPGNISSHRDAPPLGAPPTDCNRALAETSNAPCQSASTGRQSRSAR